MKKVLYPAVTLTLTVLPSLAFLATTPSFNLPNPYYQDRQMILVFFVLEVLKGPTWHHFLQCWHQMRTHFVTQISLISSHAVDGFMEAKTHTRKTQVKKPTYLPVNHDVIELTSDSDLNELSLKPPWKRQKSQDKPVKPKPRPRPKPKPKARTSPSLKVPEQSIINTQPSNIVVLPAPQEPALLSQLSYTTSCLPSSIPALLYLFSPPSSPPQIPRKRKKVSLLQSEVHGEEMDVDIPDTLSSSIIAPPLFFAPSSPIVPEIDDSHTLKDKNRNGDVDIIVAVNKGKKKDTKLSSQAKGKKKGQKQADRIELDNLAHKFAMDEPAAGNNALEDDNFIEEEEMKVISKRKALSKRTSAAKLTSKPKAKGRRKVVISESENQDSNNDPPCLRSPNPSRHLPEDEDS
ncbi:hypothetical protein EV424DRAFT_1571272 [Suillus variegatus]|nr:hypothetical protein EV424DRAFT_1571272 [Suillus variegatus]